MGSGNRGHWGTFMGAVDDVRGLMEDKAGVWGLLETKACIKSLLRAEADVWGLLEAGTDIRRPRGAEADI